MGRLVWGVILGLLGLLLLFSGFNAGQTTPFLLGGALLPIGAAFILRFFGVSQRLLMTVVGLWLIVFYLPLRHPWFTEQLRDDWQVDFSIFIISSFVLVGGAIMVIMNNTAYVQAGASWLAGRFLGLAPVIKSAASYPSAQHLPHRPLHHHVRRGHPFRDLGLRDQQQLRTASSKTSSGWPAATTSSAPPSAT